MISLSSPPVPQEDKAAIEPYIQHPLKMALPTPPDGARLLLELNALVVQSGLHWLVRNTWHSQYRHPTHFKRSFVSQTQATGLWFKHLRAMCIQVHAFGLEFGVATKYSSSIDWFYKIIEEFFYAGLHHSILSLYADSLLKYDDGTQKGMIRAASDICSKVKAYEKPSTGSALADLIFAATALGEKSDIFRAEHFIPFITSWREFIAEQKSWRHHLLTERAELFLQAGRGRGKLKLSLTQKSRSLKASRGKGFMT